MTHCPSGGSGLPCSAITEAGWHSFGGTAENRGCASMCVRQVGIKTLSLHLKSLLCFCGRSYDIRTGLTVPCFTNKKTEAWELAQGPTRSWLQSWIKNPDCLQIPDPRLSTTLYTNMDGFPRMAVLLQISVGAGLPVEMLFTGREQFSPLLL